PCIVLATVILIGTHRHIGRKLLTTGGPYTCPEPGPGQSSTVFQRRHETFFVYIPAGPKRPKRGEPVFGTKLRGTIRVPGEIHQISLVIRVVQTGEHGCAPGDLTVPQWSAVP